MLLVEHGYRFYCGPYLLLQAFLSALPKIMEGSWLYDLNYWRPEKLLHYLPIFALAFTCQTLVLLWF